MTDNVHPILGVISGMCTDERPYTEIDSKVLDAKDRAHRLEAERDRYREALEEIAQRSAVERNPDGADQAAHTMQMVAREALLGEVSRTA